MKTKACKHCGKDFEPSRPMQSVCGPRCAAWWAIANRKEKAKAENAMTKQRKAAIKKISEIEAECREIVQKIARIRDRHDPCISCDKPASWDGQWHGSHFRSHGGCSSLQFNLFNIHKACWVCNKLYSGNSGPYEEKLRIKLGNERVDWLKSQPKSQKFSREYLERFKVVMNKRCRRLQKSAGM